MLWIIWTIGWYVTWEVVEYISAKIDVLRGIDQLKNEQIKEKQFAAFVHLIVWVIGMIHFW